MAARAAELEEDRGAQQERGRGRGATVPDGPEPRDQGGRRPRGGRRGGRRRAGRVRRLPSAVAGDTRRCWRRAPSSLACAHSYDGRSERSCRWPPRSPSSPSQTTVAAERRREGPGGSVTRLRRQRHPAGRNVAGPRRRRTASHVQPRPPAGVGPVTLQILLTNDDGIGAPGLAVAARALEPIADVTTIAPRGTAAPSRAASPSIATPRRAGDLRRRLLGLGGRRHALRLRRARRSLGVRRPRRRPSFGRQPRRQYGRRRDLLGDRRRGARGRCTISRRRRLGRSQGAATISTSSTVLPVWWPRVAAGCRADRAQRQPARPSSRRDRRRTVRARRRECSDRLEVMLAATAQGREYRVYCDPPPRRRGSTPTPRRWPPASSPITPLRFDLVDPALCHRRGLSDLRRPSHPPTG